MIFVKLTVLFLFTMSSFISYTITVQPKPSAGPGNSSINPPGIVFVRYRLTPHLLIYDLYTADCFVSVTMSSHISSYINSAQPRPSVKSSNSSVNPPGIVFERYPLNLTC